jgi:hypothetical protein
VRRHALVLLTLVASAPAFHAAQLTLTPAEVADAVRVGQTRIAADRTRFHAPYRISASQPPVDYVDIVTPYRRVALAADERARLGDRSFGQRQAIELLNTAGGRFDFIVELTFHPLNTFVTMPPYDVALIRGRARLEPAALERRPRFGARVENVPSTLPTPAGLIPNSGAQPMLGGTLIAQYEGAALDLTGTMEMVVADGTRELARVKIDLGRIR